MKMNGSVAGLAVLVSMMAIATGCASVQPGPSRGYVNPNDDQFGRSDRMEYTQKSRSIVRILEQMKTDPMFSMYYKKALERAHGPGRSRMFPTIAVKPIENNTGDGRSDAAVTSQIYRELLTALRKMGQRIC